MEPANRGNGKTLKGHAHWINSLALNTDYTCRTGFYEPKKISEIKKRENLKELYALALKCSTGEVLEVQARQILDLLAKLE